MLLPTSLEICAPFVFSVEYDGTNRSVNKHFTVRRCTESTLGEIRDVLALLSLDDGMSVEFLPRSDVEFSREWNSRPLAGVKFRAEKVETVYEADGDVNVVRATCRKVVSRWADACRIFARDDELTDMLEDVVKDFESRGFEVVPVIFGEDMFTS